MNGADADRTQERPTMDDEDVAAVLRTGKMDALDAYAAVDAIPTTRALPSVEGTQEIRAVDILEVIPAAAASADIPVDVEEPAPRATTASSIAPFAIEVARRAPLPPVMSEASEASFVARIGPPRRLRAIVEVVMAASLLILAAAALRAHFAPEETDATPIVLVDAKGTARASAAPPPATVDVRSLPIAAAPTTGILTRPSGAKFVVDGVPLSGTSAVVTCGEHVVRVGGGKPRKIDVPCGGTLAL